MDSSQSAYYQWLARRQAHIRLCVAGGEDRLSALHDDMLRLILRHLDTRSALATAALSKRWARLPRDLPVLEFRVGDVLPEDYHRYLRRRLNPGPRDATVTKLDALIARYERRSMRSLSSSVTSFLQDADDGHAEARRSAQAMVLELFPSHNPGPFNRLIATAVGDWGVRDLEITVLKSAAPCDDVSYSFPHRCFEDSEPAAGAGGLKRLRLSNCAPLPARNSSGGPSRSRAPRAFASLAVLVLQDMPRAIPSRAYGRVVRACPVLETLHLKRCSSRGRVSIGDAHAAASSRIRELVVDACAFRSVAVGALPMLERLACQGAPVTLTFGSLPRLARLNLSFYDDPNAGPDPQYAAFFGPPDENAMLKFSGPLPGLESLVVRHTGPEMWIVALPDLHAPLRTLRRLLIADVPRSWDVSWTCRLLEAAPLLATLHVHVADHDSEPSAYGPAIPEPPSGFDHRALREAVILGFKGTEAQVRFVRFLGTACRALEKVVLLKQGRVRDKGLWDWDVVAPQQEFLWGDEERDVVLREIAKGGDNSGSTTMRIVLG